MLRLWIKKNYHFSNDSKLPCSGKNQTPVLFSPPRCSLFGEVWTQQSHLNVDQNSCPKQIMEHFLCGQNVRFQKISDQRSGLNLTQNSRGLLNGNLSSLPSVMLCFQSIFFCFPCYFAKRITSVMNKGRLWKLCSCSMLHSRNIHWYRTESSYVYFLIPDPFNQWAGKTITLCIAVMHFDLLGWKETKPRMKTYHVYGPQHTNFRFENAINLTLLFENHCSLKTNFLIPTVTTL